MTDKYLPSTANDANNSATSKVASLKGTGMSITPVDASQASTQKMSTNLTISSASTGGVAKVDSLAVGSIILKPLEWSAHFRKLAMDYMGEPEQVEFMNAARWFAAVAKVLPHTDEEKPDGFVVGGDIT